MPMNPAVQAVIKAITRLQPDVANSWNSQRKVEDAAGKLTIADPRCRIDEITATADDGYEIPLRVFTPLDIDFSLKRGLHVTAAPSCTYTAAAGPTATWNSTATPACARR